MTGNFLLGIFLSLSLSTSAFALKPWIGKQRAVVVLVEWSNVSANVSVEHIEDTFFSDHYADQRSLRTFFQENAQGAFDMTGNVLAWKTSSKGFTSSAGCDLQRIVNEGWSLFSSDITIADYDSDKNGKIDNFFVIHSGRIGSDRVGPECTFTTHARADFAVVFQSEGIGSVGEAIPIGFYIHEGGHEYYSFPDLYGDHYNGRYGIGMWGMMGLGAWGVRNDISKDELFRYPAHFEPLSKIKIGWLKPRIIRTTQRQVEIKPVELTGDIVAVPRRSGSNFYLEYRTPTGFSKEHHGHGLLIWQDYDLIQADGRDDINNGNPQGKRPLPPITENFGDATDPFPGDGQVTTYEDKSSGVRFENITQTADKIVVDIVFENAAAFYFPSEVEVFSGVEGL